MYVTAVISGYILITLMELIPFWKNKKKKELIVYLVIMTVSLIISVYLVLGVQMPTISNIIAKIFFMK
jgi:accessory gene regulator protein AgrB